MLQYYVMSESLSVLHQSCYTKSIIYPEPTRGWEWVKMPLVIAFLHPRKQEVYDRASFHVGVTSS